MTIFNDDYDWDVFQPIAEDNSEDPPERKLWEFMVTYQHEHHMPPTMDEMLEVLDAPHRSSAKHYVEKLVRAKWVEVVAEEGKSRRYHALNAPLATPVEWDDLQGHVAGVKL